MVECFWRFQDAAVTYNVLKSITRVLRWYMIDQIHGGEVDESGQPAAQRTTVDPVAAVKCENTTCRLCVCACVCVCVCVCCCEHSIGQHHNVVLITGGNTILRHNCFPLDIPTMLSSHFDIMCISTIFKGGRVRHRSQQRLCGFCLNERRRRCASCLKQISRAT